MAAEEVRKTFVSFKERLTLNMWQAQRDVERVTCYLQEPRHVEEISGMETGGDPDDCSVIRRKGSDRLRTASVAIVMCLHLGVDPPDSPSRKDAPARLLAWIDPYKCGAHKAAMEVGLSTQRAYEKWQPKSNTRTRYKICTDPPVDDVRKIALNLRRISGSDRVLFHYNGHGVPRPTENGEIWVFNKNFTQYIPLSIFDLQIWLDYPTIYIWETHSAETILNNFRRFGEDQRMTWQNNFDRWQEEQTNLPPISSKMSDWQQAEAMGFPDKYPKYNLQDCIHLAACSVNQFLPMSNPHLPADLFTSCLTTPIRTSLAFHLSNSEHRDEYPENILDMIPGNLAERRTVLGELNWIFTAITDTIAFTSLEKELFQKLFRQDLLLATLFRSFLLAQRVMGKFDVLPVSQPHLKDTSKHELWICWDQTMDMVLDYVRELMYVRESQKALFCGREVMTKSNVFPFLVLINPEHVLSYNESLNYNTFFTEQLQAFELWLDYGVNQGTPPLQLPMVLQVLLSQAHRVRALRLLARFLDFGRWAISYSLAVGIFPYVLKLLQSNIGDLKISLAFIWAKILAVDPSCQVELFNECIDEAASASANQQQAAQQAPPQPSVISKPSTMFLYNPQVPPSQLTMDKRGLQPQQPEAPAAQAPQQQGIRFQFPAQGGGPNQAAEMQMQHAQQRTPQSPNPQRQQQNPQNPQQPGQAQPKPGILKQPQQQQQPEKKTMLRFQYFLNLLSDPEIHPKQKTVAAFVLAQLTSNDFKLAQKELTTKGYLGICVALLFDDKARSVNLLKLWLLIGLGRLWSDYDQARWMGIRLMAHDKVLQELNEGSAEVRAAAVFALGSLLKNSSKSNEHASAVEENIADELCINCVFDSSSLVREELIVSLQWFVFDFEKRFVKLMLDLSRICKFDLPQPEGSLESLEEEGYDVAAEMPSNRVPRTPPIKDYTQPSLIRKKMSTSVFTTAVEEVVYQDAAGNMMTIAHDAGHIERDSADMAYSRAYRTRAMSQIRHLEAKTFNEGVARTWLAVLRLSLDPVERVARMAQKIVHRIEAGIPEMQANINNTMAHLNKKMIERKLSKATVEMPRKPVGVSQEASHLAKEIHERLEIEKVPAEMGPNENGIDFTELKKIQDEKMNRRKGKVNKLKEESRVKFLVGSPGEAVANGQKNVLSPASPTSDESSELFSKDPESEIGGYRPEEEQKSGTIDKDGAATTASEKTTKGPFRKTELMEMHMKEFTPKRANKIKGPSFTKQEESQTLRSIIENPIVSTQFVPWCSKVFIEPILHVIALDEVKTDYQDDEEEFMPEEYREKIKELHAADLKRNEQKRKQDEKEGKKNKSQEELVLTTTTISDWAIHAMEGMIQSVETESRDFANTRYDHCLWQVKLPHPAKSIVTSKLRSCMYASDGHALTIIRQDKEPESFRSFDLTQGNPFCTARASQLILINEESREMIMACSPNGVVRIWDPHFFPWCDDFAQPAELLLACTALENEMVLSDETNRCLFDWNQTNGKLLCTGSRSIRVWDAHAEKVCQDVPYSMASMQSQGPVAKRDKFTLPTAMAGNLDDEGNFVCVGYADGRVDYFDMRMKGKAASAQLDCAKDEFSKISKEVMCLKVNRKGYDTDLFIGRRDNLVYKLSLRMYRDSPVHITTPWVPGRHDLMYVHDDSRILATCSGSELAIYDVAQRTQMASISPPKPNYDHLRREKSTGTFGLFSSAQRKSSTATIASKISDEGHRPNVLSLTMHQMRLLTVAGYDDNTVCVYGSTTPGLTGHYETNQSYRPTSSNNKHF